jgi:hypothetical protein
MADAGLRASEVLHLLVEDWRAADRGLFVRAGKGRKDRVAFIEATTNRALRAWLGRPGGYLIQPAHGGKRGSDAVASEGAHLGRTGHIALARVLCLDQNPDTPRLQSSDSRDGGITMGSAAARRAPCGGGYTATTLGCTERKETTASEDQTPARISSPPFRSPSQPRPFAGALGGTTAAARSSRRGQSAPGSRGTRTRSRSTARSPPPPGFRPSTPRPPRAGRGPPPRRPRAGGTSAPGGAPSAAMPPGAASARRAPLRRPPADRAGTRRAGPRGCRTHVSP